MSLKSACCTLQTLMMSAQRESGGADREMEKRPSITGDDDLILPGFRFHPTDEELVGFYLRRKVEKKPTAIELIKQIDIYKYDPWDLPKGCRAGEKEWYFFCQRERKYRNSIRPNRVTGSGFWKATGIDKSINSPGEKTNCCIGLKKSLVYYRGSAGKCAKTDWMMHEFRLPFTTKNTSTLPTPNNIQEAEIWTICRIFRRRVSDTKHMRPNWKEESMKQNTGSRDSTSQRSIYEFSDAEKERLNYFFGASTTEPVSEECEEKKHLFPGRSSLPNSNAGKSYKYENWDELGAVVDFAIDPNL